MEQNMKGLFEQALAAEPVPPPGDLARTAMADGTRLRRRRWLAGGGAAGGVVAVLAAAVALNVGASDQYLPGTVAAPAPSACTSAETPANDVSIFLRNDISDQQRANVNATLGSDPLVRTVQFESREQAYEKFKVLWRDSPDFAKSVNAADLPESFRVTLTAAAAYPAFQARIAKMPGIESIVGGTCPSGAAPGEGK